jgi:hypothetical protein
MTGKMARIWLEKYGVFYSKTKRSEKNVYKKGRG